MQNSNELELNASQEVGHEQVTPPMEAQPVETVNNSRRAFLMGLGATLTAATLGSEEAEAQQPRVVAMANKTSGAEKGQEVAKPMIEKLKDGNYVVRANPLEENGEGLRGPSALPPKMLVPQVITLTSTYELEPTGGPVDQHFLIQTPRDIGNFARHLSKIYPKITGLNDLQTEISFVDADSDNPQIKNRFMSIRVQGTPNDQQPIKVVIKHLACLTTPPVKGIENEGLLAAKMDGALVQGLANLMKAVNDETKYNAGIPSLDPTLPEGDCGVFAAKSQVKYPHLRTLLGYTTRGIATNGGMHAYNENDAHLRFDATMKSCGQETGDYFTTQVGPVLLFPEDSIWKGASGNRVSYNRGGKMGFNASVTKSETVLSVPGVGIDGEKLKSFRLDPAEAVEVIEASKKFILERKKIEAEGQKRPGIRSTAKN